MARIGVIGGSGIYNIDEVENKQWKEVQTPFGKPSDRYLVGELRGELHPLEDLGKVF